MNLLLALPVFFDFCPCATEVFRWLLGIVFGVTKFCPFYSIV